ncbi:MAG: ROK family protein [Candidatus Gastranaerophilales bacterium]|nr:ROK family protein [Candidatus Gastranaerophilales bacterium]
MKKALAFDIGGTKIYYTLVDETGNVCGEVEKNSTPKTIDGIVNILKTAINKYEQEVDIIAIATAGAVNKENTNVISSTGNLVENYRDIPFQELSVKKVFMENDANAAAWAEHVVGSSKNCDNSVMLTLGTGVGGGIIIDNKLFKGKSGAAGEMHFKMYPDKRRKCTCGAYDCFESYASGTGLKLTAEEMLNNPDVTTYDVIAGVKSGDEKMIAVLDKWEDYIIQGIIGLANLFDPDCFVLSGSMAEFVNVDKIEKAVNSEIVTTATSIRKSSAGNYSGMIGAALLALESLRG